MHFDGLNVMYLTKGEFNILNWLAILLAHRKFDITSPVGNNAREFILSHFMPDTTDIVSHFDPFLFSYSSIHDNRQFRTRQIQSA